jgi:hypothetical protein
MYAASFHPPQQAPPGILKRCRQCGAVPAARVRVGKNLALGWFECETCGFKTRDGQSYELAWREWNERNDVPVTTH